MKKIINGKMYNTDTAVKIAEGSFGYPGNFDYFKEALFRKKTGEYFLAGQGGAASKYAEMCDIQTWGPDKKITPLTEDEAKAWGERALDADEYEAIFGEVAE